VPDYKLADDVTLVRLAAGEQALGTIHVRGFEGPAGVLARSGQSLYLGTKAGLLGSPQRPARLSSSPPYEGGDRGGVRWLGPRDVGWQRIVTNSVRWGVQDNFPVRLVNAPPGLILAAAQNGTDVVVQLLHAPVRSEGEVYDPNACSFTPPKLKGGRLPELRLRSSQRPTRVTLRSPDFGEPATTRQGTALRRDYEQTLRSPDLSETATLAVLRRGAEWSVALPPEALRRYAVVVWEVNE
jgi:hypothetical protein